MSQAVLEPDAALLDIQIVASSLNEIQAAIEKSRTNLEKSK